MYISIYGDIYDVSCLPDTSKKVISGARVSCLGAFCWSKAVLKELVLQRVQLNLGRVSDDDDDDDDDHDDHDDDDDDVMMMNLLLLLLMFLLLLRGWIQSCLESSCLEKGCSFYCLPRHERAICIDMCIPVHPQTIYF